MSTERQNFGTIAALSALVAFTYLRVIGFDFVNWDDPVFVLSDLVADWSAQPWSERLLTSSVGYAVPLPTAIWAALESLVGYGNPCVFHAVNLVFHTASVGLLFTLIRRFGASAAAAFVGASLWALHPVVVEPVAWVTGLKDVGSAFGVLLALHGVFDLYQNKSNRGAILALGGTLVALGFKPTGMVAGPLMLILSLLLAKKGRVSRPAVGAAIAATAGGLASTVLAFVTHKAYGGHGTANALELFVSAGSLQVQNYLLPFNLSPHYFFHGVSPIDWVIVGAVMAMLCAGIVVTYKRGYYMPLFGILLVIVAYAPTSNIVPLARYTADSYAYLPTMGFGLIAGSIWSYGHERFSKNSLRLVSSALVIVLVVLTLGQQKHWTEGPNLWQRAIDVGHGKEAQSFRYFNLADSLARYGAYDEAIRAFEQGDQAEYGVKYPVSPMWPVSYWKAGRIDDADRIFRVCLSGERQQVSFVRSRVAVSERYEEFRDETGR